MPIVQKGVGKYIINVFSPTCFSVKLQISISNGIYKERRGFFFLTIENRDIFQECLHYSKNGRLILCQENM